jgi:hypothetical protein
MRGEAVGKVGEEVGENLSLSSLRAKDLGEHDPMWIGTHGIGC